MEKIAVAEEIRQRKGRKRGSYIVFGDRNGQHDFLIRLLLAARRTHPSAVHNAQTAVDGVEKESDVLDMDEGFPLGFGRLGIQQSVNVRFGLGHRQALLNDMM